MATVKELRAKVKSLFFKGYSQMNKAELEKLISDYEASEEAFRDVNASIHSPEVIAQSEQLQPEQSEHPAFFDFTAKTLKAEIKKHGLKLPKIISECNLINCLTINLLGKNINVGLVVNIGNNNSSTVHLSTANFSAHPY